MLVKSYYYYGIEKLMVVKTNEKKRKVYESIKLWRSIVNMKETMTSNVTIIDKWYF